MQEVGGSKPLGVTQTTNQDTPIHQAYLFLFAQKRRPSPYSFLSLLFSIVPCSRCRLFHRSRWIFDHFPDKAFVSLSMINSVLLTAVSLLHVENLGKGNVIFNVPEAASPPFV